MGQRMERITFKNSRSLSLVGNLYRADSNIIVIMAHGFTNDKSSQGRFDKIANALSNLNLDVLTFDFSGCGESDADILTAEKQVDDLNSAIALMKAQGYEKIALFGYSLGSLICLKCYQEGVDAMVLLGALTHSMKYDWNEELTPDQLSELERTGLMSIETEAGFCRVGHQMLRDFEEINQEALLKKVTCPVLIIHGNNEEDQEEIQLLSNSRKGLHLLSDASDLVVIDGAKHDFKEDVDKVIELSTRWYLNHLVQA